MDDSHCPLGSLCAEARKTAAIGLRIAQDNLRLPWSRQAQMRHDEAKKTADEALAAWNEHVRGCLVCSNAGPGPVQDRADFVITPTVLLVDNNHALLDQLVRMLQPNCKIAAALSCGAMVVDRAAALQPDLIILDISLGDVNGFEVANG